MSILLHISDTHFGTEQPPVVEALVTLAREQHPDLTVLSGDITQRALRTQFRAARSFVDRLHAPVLAIPGNHDIPLLDLCTRLLFPHRRQCEVFGDDLEPVFASPDLLVVCANTTRRWRHKNGDVSALQIERIAAQLAGASSAQLRLVVVHQPVEVIRDQDVHDRLRGNEPALRRWADAGADLVLGGHIHLPYVAAIKRFARPLWVVQAGTAVSSRVRAGVPNSVNIIRCGAAANPDGCTIEQWDYAVATQAFVRSVVTLAQPDRGR